jgi:iron complex outermembrane receptor protein
MSNVTGHFGQSSLVASAALVAVGLAAPMPAPAQTRTSGVPAQAALEEVIVTAQKLREKTLDVPMSLTVLSGEQLAASQAFRFEDFAGKVPNLAIIGVGGFGTQLVLRGITTGTYTINSSVATYVDETPYTSNGSVGLSAAMAPNLDTFDMQRIEVLRGPQGTLYGANAMGGVLKYITNAPDPAGFAASGDASVTSVDGGDTGYNLHAMVNVPLTETTALRLVGYDNEYPGFVDDPSRGMKNINGSSAAGGRASLLYKATDDLSIRFNAFYQRRSWDDYGNVDVDPYTLKPITGDLTAQSLVGNPGEVTNQLYNLTVDWNLGFAKLLSATSYVDYKSDARFDVSQTYGVFLSEFVLGVPVGLIIQQASGMHAFIQELRLSSPAEGSLQWQAGAYFVDQSGFVNQDTYIVDPASRQILWESPFAPFDTGGFYNDQDYREFAAFVNVDYHFTPTLDVALGGRYSDNSQQFHEHAFGLLGGEYTGFPTELSAPSSENVFTYSGDARWHMTPEMMLYGRIATGFVPGGGNNVPYTAPADLPRSYTSSTTTNYEAGFKGTLLDGRASFEVSVFDIEWKDIQIAAGFQGVLTTLNGGKAQSSGVEWNFGAVPITGLALNLNGAYTDAHLTEDLPSSVGGQDGDRLPGSPRWSASFSADYEWPLGGSYSGIAGLNWRYAGDRLSDFVAAGDRRITVPSFDVVDLRLGIVNPRWTLSFYVKNLGDTFAINNVSAATLAGGYGTQAANIYQPRTFGLTLGAKY